MSMSEQNSQQPQAQQGQQSNEGEKAQANTSQQPKEKAPEKQQPQAQQGQQSNEGEMTGNKDKEEKYPFSKSWAKSVVVRQSNNIPGYATEDPATVKLMPYESDVFENIKKTGGFKGYNVLVIHDPRK